MKPWKTAVLLAAAWFALMIVVAVVHTEILIRDIKPERDEALSSAYGQAAGVGAIVLGALGFRYQRRRYSRSRDVQLPH